VGPDGELAQRFREIASSAATRSPLYARLAASIADDPSTSRLLLHAPPAQRLPVLLFACVHWLLISEPDHELRRYYPNLVDEPDADDPYPAFRAFCARHEPRLAGLLATRSTQTNEVGRCATLLPALGLVADEVGALALVDVGASGGLNLLLDRYEYRYEPQEPGAATRRVGGPSDVVLRCGTRGAVPVPERPPALAARVGLDRAPIDLTDDDAATWLEACVWPDQADRFRRLRAAIALARADPPDVRAGDAVDDLAATVALVAAEGHVVVVDTWVLNYLSTDERRSFVGELDRLGADHDLSWVFAEAPSLVEGIPAPDLGGDSDLTALSLVRWRGGVRTVDHLATAHPHGFWLHWRG
jgi:hypothetical protein